MVAGGRVGVKPARLRVGCLFELQLGGFGRDLAHLLDELSQSAVVGDPFLVELCFGLVEPAGDGFAVVLGGPLVVGAVGLGRLLSEAQIRHGGEVQRRYRGVGYERRSNSGSARGAERQRLATKRGTGRGVRVCVAR